MAEGQVRFLSEAVLRVLCLGRGGAEGSMDSLPEKTIDGGWGRPYRAWERAGALLAHLWLCPCICDLRAQLATRTSL